LYKAGFFIESSAPLCYDNQISSCDLEGPVIDKLEALEARFEDLNTKLSDPDVVSDQKAYKEIMQEYSHLQTIMEEYSSYKKINEDLEGPRTCWQMRLMQSSSQWLKKKSRILKRPKQHLKKSSKSF
jgi:peptide chain release factor 1